MHIYKEIAALAIKNWYLWNEEPEIATKKAKEIAALLDNKQIENGIQNADKLAEQFQNENLKNLQWGIGALTSIVTGIRSFGISTNNQELAKMSDEQIKDALLNEDTSFETMLAKTTTTFLSDPVQLISKLEERGLGKELEGLDVEEIKRLFKQIVVIDALEGIHDKWVEDSNKKFFDPKRTSKQYMHMQFELIGWNDVDLDKIFLSPVLDAAKFGEVLEDVKSEYLYRQVELYKEMIENGILAAAKNYKPLANQENIIEQLNEEEILSHIRELVEKKSGFDLKKEVPRFLSEMVKMQQGITFLEESQTALQKTLEFIPDKDIEERIKMIKEQVECVKKKIEKISKEKNQALTLMKKVMGNAIIEGTTLKTSKNITQEELDAVLKFYKDLEFVNINGKIIDLRSQNKIIGTGNIDEIIASENKEKNTPNLVNPNLGER